MNAKNIGNDQRMRWNCAGGDNCFNKVARLKFEKFKGCFPDRIGMMDIDGMVEVDGHLLFVESKNTKDGFGGTAVRLAFRKLTRASERITAIWIIGCAETMEFHEFCIIRNGCIGEWMSCTTQEICEFMQGWSDQIRPRRAA